MSIEQRIRDGLAANAGYVDAPVEANLERLFQRRRRRVRVKVGVALALLALAAGTPWAAVNVLRGDEGVQPAQPVTPTLVGKYQVDVDGGRGTQSMSGTWVATLSDDGDIRLEPPDGYSGPPPGDGEAYVVSGDELTTNSFLAWPGCQQSDPPVGRYRFETSPTGVTFETVEDTCPARLHLFDAPWERLP
jgi:hypothetical protein